MGTVAGFKRSIRAFHLTAGAAVVWLTLWAPTAASPQQIAVVSEWGGRGQPPCPATANGFYRPDAGPTDNLSLPGFEWWCEPGEAVIGYAVELPASHYLHQDDPTCPEGWQPEYGVLAARALRAASANLASTEMPQSLVLTMVADWLAPLAERDAPGTVGRIVGGLRGTSASCRVLGAAVPEGKRITRIQTTLAASSAAPSSSAHCGLFRTASTGNTAPPNHGCAADNPAVPDSGAGVAFEAYRIEEGSVTVTVKDWSDHPARVAYLRVYYVP